MLTATVFADSDGASVGKRRYHSVHILWLVAFAHGLLLVIDTSGRYTAGRLILSGLYVSSSSGGSHVAQVANAQPMTRQRARNLIAFMDVVSLSRRRRKSTESMQARFVRMG